MQGHEHPHRRRQGAAPDVSDLAGRLEWWTVGLPGQSEQAVQAQIIHVMARPVAVGAVLPVAGDGAIDQPRVDRLEALPAHAEAVEHAGAEGLEQYVSVSGQPEQDLLALIVLEVDAD